MKISTKDLQVMKTTIGLRSDLVKTDGTFTTDRDCFYIVKASLSIAERTDGSKIMKRIQNLIDKGLMEERKRKRFGEEIICFTLSKKGLRMLEKIFDCRILYKEELLWLNSVSFSAIE